MASKKIDFGAVTPKAAFDDLFGGQMITQLDIADLVPCPFNKFRPYTQEKLEELAANIKIKGVTEPISVRKLLPNDDCPYLRYEILAGHNRTNASKLAGLEKIPAIVYENLSDSDAADIMIDTNKLRRDRIYPSELAASYSLQMEFRHATSCRMLAEMIGENERKVQRYYRLSFLIKEFLEIIDDEDMSIQSGVALSYLSETEQQSVFRFMEDTNLKIDLSRAEQIKRYKEEMNEFITYSFLESIFAKQPAIKKEKSMKVTIEQNIYKRYFDSYSPKQAQNKINEILLNYFNGKDED